MTSSAPFREKVEKVMLTIDPAAYRGGGPTTHNGLEIAQGSGVQVRLFRRGKVMSKRDRRTDGHQYTAKQLKLRRHVKVSEGSFLASGHIAAMPSSELEIEVS